MKLRHKFGQVAVIGLGGSIIYPDRLDIEFLRAFKKCIDGFVKRGRKFIIVAGGGRVSRLYQETASKIPNVTNEDKDWLGIYATYLNAHILRVIFQDLADPTIIDTRRKIKKLKYPVTIAAGWRPGWSTDFVAFQLALDFGVKEVIIAGKPSHVYDKDFMKYKNAKPFSRISWRNYRKLVPAKWHPGFHAPVDQVAARFAERARIAAIVVSGKNLKNFSNLLLGREFTGTIIC